MAKEKTVVIVTVGVALQMFLLEDVSFAKALPDAEVTLPASALVLPGLPCLIARVEIEGKDGSGTNREIRAAMAKLKKPDPWDKMSVTELEDGGEYY
ncbi:hypothetical protein HOS16_gp34 [Shigella phage vB_SflS-ISF001]|uniref:Uncharacterized protein n=1 Tax=Shigella phage vB_SflS-ISF001 TaxID=2048005 RepID=A0A2D1GPZ0_9CAUD|nr:hypothetical protein HOS16_gp34 [Shigella phage vB_SflS-ISF001]ATN94112.1 hypothetical protein FLXISF001_034 [Shigella phage vB_SflS-ISF001]